MNTVQSQKIIADFLTSKGAVAQRELFESALLKALKWVDDQVASDVFNLAAIGSSDPTTSIEQEKAREVLFQFLEKAIDFKKSPAIFLSQSAPALKAQTFDRSNLYTNDVHIYQSVQNFGIQEKYIRGLLNKTHWLTDLDIQRSLKYYGLSDKVKISPFTEPSLRATIDLAVKDHGGATKPYSIPLILNRGSLGSNQGTHWLSAQITIDPVGHKISYQIDDSLKLSEDEIQQYKSIIEEAVAAKVGEFHNPFPTEGGWTIDRKASSITGHESQTDGYSCGYRALRQLVSDPAVRGDNLDAKHYSELPLDSESLINSLFQDQLKDLSVSVELFEGLPTKGQQVFAESFGSSTKVKTISLDKLESFLTGAPKIPKQEVSKTHSKIDKVIGSFTQTSSIVRFPEGAKDDSLTAVEYDSFFDKLHNIDNIEHSNLKRIDLPYVTSDALDGITSYFALNHTTAFKEIGLFIDQEPAANKDAFLSKLKLSISTLSKAGLEKIELRDEHGQLNKKALEDLKEFAVQVGLTCKIKLPGDYATSPLQRELDKIIERNQQKKNNSSLSEEQRATSEKSSIKSIRQREKFDFSHSKQVDIELQDSVEADVAIEMAFDKAQEENDFVVKKSFTLDDLKTAVNENDFTAFSDLKVIMRKEDFVKAWHQIFGNIAQGQLEIGAKGYGLVGNQEIHASSLISRISDDALQQLLRDGHLPANGIDFQHLPQGFVLLNDDKKRGGRVLHYDANYKKYDLIAPIIDDKPRATPLIMDTVEEMMATLEPDAPLRTLWNNLNDSDAYDSTKHQQFRELILDIASLPNSAQKKLIELCGGVGHLDLDRLNAFFKNRTELARLYKEPFDASSILNASVIDKSLNLSGSDIEVTRSELIKLASQAGVVPVSEHPLLKIITTHPETRSKLQAAIDQYHLTPAILNDLTRLYSTYGVGGIEKVLKTWDEIRHLDPIKPDIAAQIIVNSNPQHDIINHQDLVISCKRLNDFSPNKREWFLQLYANHSPKSGKDFVDLLASFTEFSRQVENEYQLSFYSLADLEHPFTQDVDMRTAMGRMLSIMDACNRTDLGAQWDKIAELDLRSNAAIRAVRANSQDDRRCYFVVPEMDINPEDPDVERTVFDTVPNINTIAPKTEDDGEVIFNADDAATVQKRFFRYLSYQEHRMPLSFYTKAVEQIEAMGKPNTTIERAQLNILYRILADVSSGKNYQYFIHNEQEAQAQWNHIVERILGAQLKINPLAYKLVSKAAGGDVNTQIYKQIISSLGELNTVPTMEVMDRLVILMTSTIDLYNKDKIGITEFKSSMEKLNQSNHMLRELTRVYGDKIYMGMKFYGEDSYQKTYAVPVDMKKTYGERANLFDHHTLVAFSLNQKSKNGFDRFAIPLISTFSLDHDNIDELYSLHQTADTPIKSTLMEYLGTILLDISNNSELDAAALHSLMSGLLQLSKQVESSLQQAFEQFEVLKEKMQAGELTPEEQEHYTNINLLKMYLDNDIDLDEYSKKILINLAKPKIVEFLETNSLLGKALPTGYVDNFKSKKATGNVVLLIDKEFKTQELKANVEKIRVKYSALPEEQLIQIIKDVATILNQCDTESEKLEVATALTNLQLLSEGAESYTNLLNAIKKSGSNPFVYYMQQAQLFAQRNNTPIEGLSEKAAYFIGDAIPNLANRYKNINVVEFAPLISSVISAGQQKELSSKVEVGERYKQWNQLLTDLSSAKSSPEQIELILAGLDPSQSSAINDLSSLNDHLHKLKNPTLTRVELSYQEEVVAALESNTTDALSEYTFEERLVTVPKAAGAFKKFLGLFVTQEPETEQVKKFYKITKTFKEVRDPESLNNELVNQVISQVQAQEIAAVTYAHALAESIATIDKLIETYPSAKSMLLPLTRNYLEYKNTTGAGIEEVEAHIKQAYSNLRNLYEELTLIDDQDMVISLCEHFSKDGQYKFTDLLTLFNGGILADDTSFSGYTSLDDEAKKQLFTIITSLLNNKKPCTLSDIQQLIIFFNDKEHGAQYLAAVTAIYKKAPYPELSTFNKWWTDATTTDSLEEISEQYKQWSKKPVAREEEVNGFNLQYAQEQYKKMSGIEYTDQELQDIKTKTEEVKDLTTDELLAKIEEIRENPEVRELHKKDPTELVALMSELLYRTKGMPQEGIENSRKWGNSFEINTTQYLGVHSLLKSGKPTIAGIGTGEGKSRIMMISLAVQWALGRTVDFVTADVTLATRDYLEYQAYFKSFGAKTNLITAQTPVDQYCLDGINFSDSSNLSLFRNKARSQGLGHQVINPKKEDRCLLLDEADKTLFDTIDTRYNYSAQADQSIQDMPWIYESLVKFFKVPENEALFHGPESDADECNRKFKEYVKANLTSAKDIQKLERISRTQLESWQASAITALKLEYGKDFTLEANVPIVTKKGPSIVSQARLIAGGTASKNAKFSFGVHQCLHARLNLEKAQVVTHGATKDNLLHQELSRAQFDDRRFPVDSENQIIYSSTSKALIDDYDVIRGVTGTPGSWTERAEKANMAFIDIPRHRGINRIDKPYQLVKNNDIQFQKIIAEIRTSIVNKQPILLICKDDRQSKQLFDYLNKNLTDIEKKQLNRVSADTSIDEEAELVEEVAGKAGAITVTTARMGRGTDIRLHDEAKKNGLHVVGTYLPRERDYIQIVGRAGRFGAQGSSRLILNEETMRQSFSQANQLAPEFYTATESYLRHLQTVMDIQAQKQRIIKDAVSDFRMNLTTSFFNDFFKPIALKEVNHDLVIDKWRKFFDASDKVWNETWPKISEALANGNMEQVEHLLQEYHAEVQGYWKGMLEELKMDFADNKEINVDALPDNVSNIKLSKRGIELLKYDVGTNVVLKTAVVDKYDEAYQGRAVIYKGFWQNLTTNVLPSIFSWKDTPYTQARKNGNMSWSQFLFGGNLGTPPKTDESKFTSSLNEKEATAQISIGLKGSSTAKIFSLGVATPTAVNHSEEVDFEQESEALDQEESLDATTPTVLDEEHNKEVANGMGIR